MCPIPNGFWVRAISLYSSLDLAHDIILPSCRAAPLPEACESVGVKRQLAVVTVESDIAGMLWKKLHIFRNVEVADMLYVYGFCDASATAAVQEYRRWFPIHRIPDRGLFSKVFNTLSERGTLPSAHVSS
jgi:hypothetical protein